MLTQKQVANILGLSTRTVQRMTALGLLRGMRYVGVRATRYDADDITSWLKRTGDRRRQVATKRY